MRALAGIGCVALLAGSAHGEPASDPPALLGVRLQPGYIGSFPLRTDTPFGSYASGIALAVLHDAPWIPSLRLGGVLEYHPRQLNSIAAGVAGLWCPQRFGWTWGVRFTWCPAGASLAYVAGERDGDFLSGDFRVRATTAGEVRYRAGFARLAVGLAGENYARKFLSGTESLWLWSSVIEASLGVDL